MSLQRLNDFILPYHQNRCDTDFRMMIKDIWVFAISRSNHIDDYSFLPEEHMLLAIADMLADGTEDGK